MPIVEIVASLAKEIVKRFSASQAIEITDLLETLQTQPNKGKILGSVGGIVIKELKYKTYRFYCIYDGFRLQVMEEERLVDLLFRFVRMSNKKEQQTVIDEIKEVLRKLGPSALK
jgi:hypothetical protein